MIPEEERENREKDREYNKTRIWIVLGSTGGLITLLGMVTLFILQLRKRKVGRYNRAAGNLMLFKYKDIRRSTKYYSEHGKGGFCSVFKGTLPNSRAAAVKRLKNLKRGEKQFRAEDPSNQRTDFTRVQAILKQACGFSCGTVVDSLWNT
ncbi:hypothetical protein POM88_029789 [Heracleum sosnowskyi]|uniref:Uncharacterized protein n=1 Tax=Heracleum sosnowskyi TaxID=360622 RepID=A0AAD8HUT4_9APIA|nr:hypothetical protein POM88_029789 [Heracleum sosnowskyi]